jgi:hypothetical protein
MPDGVGSEDLSRGSESAKPAAKTASVGDDLNMANRSSLLGRHNVILSSAAMKHDLDPIQHFLLDARQGQATLKSTADGTQSPMLKSADVGEIDPPFKGLFPAKAGLGCGVGNQLSRLIPDVNLGDNPGVMTRITADPARHFAPADFGSPGQNSKAALAPNDSDKPDGSNVRTGGRLAGAEIGWTPKAVEAGINDPVKDLLPSARVPQNVFGGQDEGNSTEKTGILKQGENPGRILPVPGYRQQLVGESIQQNMLNNEASAAAKMTGDVQAVKENQMKMEAVISDASGSKVTKIDSGATENGLLSAQNQTAERAFEASSTSRQVETGRDTLQTKTLEQIVRKAVLHLREGQHEAKIDLKPDFLGHIRFQITTENHQVNVRILTEFGFVKEMIENGLHQLKSDLQQQGLTVDKLEVSISQDSNENRHPQQRTDGSNSGRQTADQDEASKQQKTARQSPGQTGKSGAESTAIDYFA